MGDVIDIGAQLPHATITTHSGAVHVVPLVVFTDIASGKSTVDSIDFRDDLLRVIVAEWLVSVGCSANHMEQDDGPA